MIINLKVKTLDSQTHEFSIDNEITIRQFKDKIAEKTNIAAEQQRIIYCGRVLADDKQVKEYDVDGKVVHVAERPPPSARISTNPISSGGARHTARNETRGMRNSPLFRALDGMVVGAMAIPMNAGVQNQQTTINPLTSSSSSFCMNRITVARHMLDCANNIAAYLEDPERGLNNTSLDILAQGRWTMESTVVEVGISDIQQNQTHNIVEALQGAVSAALRQNGNANVTVVQLPTVFNPNGAETEASDTEAQSSNSAGGDSSASVEPMDETTSESNTNAETEENAPGLDTTEPSTQTDESGGSAAPNANQSPSRQRTGTRVLAEVIQQMRTVQARLNPFIDQYYELLQNEPVFEENDTTGRQNTQRLFDRVSEAFHYLSHAQHAISDLMLDVSRPTPRFLCCRPILVEQSGYVSSNNYTTYNPSGNGPVTMQTGSSINRQQAAAAAAGRTSTPPATASSTPAAAAGAPSTSAAGDDTSDNGNNVSEGGATTTPPPTPAATATPNAASPIQGLSANHQLQVARLIQAVVNSAPIDADFHVQINAPSILSIGVPMNGNMRPQATQASSTAQNSNQTATTQQSTETASTATATAASNAAPAASAAAAAAADSNTNSAGLNQARVDTTTHPTTSTQTRSTARPQVQVANIPSAWNTRVIPANMLSSFDRFLPCNSHHIRDVEGRENGTNNNNNSVNQTFAPPRVQTRILRRVRRPNSTSGSVNVDATASSTTPTRSPSPSVRSSSSSRAATDAATTRNCLRNQLLSFIASKMFDGSPVSEVGMSMAVEKAIHYLNEILIFLPQYDMHEYNSRASVEKLVRTSLPLIVNLINDSSDITYFETRLGTEFKLLFERLFVILFVCVGRMNAELYWAQIKQMVTPAISKHFTDEALTFLNIQIRERTPVTVNSILLDDVKPFLVLRDASTAINTTATTTSNNEVTPMDTDSCSASGSASSSSNFETSSAPPSEPDEVLPPVIVGSEAWHRRFPTTWLPIITRDIQRQTRQATQPAFSDAYISGMSAKRRKLIQSTKPAHDVKSLVAESVRRAIQTTGLQNPSSSNPTHSADEISNAIATDSSVQASFCETLRSGVKERLKTDTDFNADKFPHTSKYFNKQN